uniref:Uncharacterized protein n=1 Tax=Oryza barthii TaxID=65489 RepID=A0A0D3GJJ9_9ORYZ
MPTAKSQSHPASRAQTKPNQTKPHMTHIHTTARTHAHARPPTCRSFPLSLSFSLAGRCVFALILAAVRRINIALASPLSRLASEPTNGRASGERGEPEAGGLCASEMRELEKLRTETMMKSCQSTTSRAGAIRCPVPRKSGRSYKEYDLTQDLSDFIMSKASPPYFTGSPPVRASNPLVHDTQFCAWKLQNVDQSLSIPIPTKGCNVRYCVREGSITKA